MHRSRALERGAVLVRAARREERLVVVDQQQRRHLRRVRVRLVAQIHDELLIECHSDDADTVARLCRAEMERRDIGDVTLKVPLVAEVGIGPS